MPNQSTDSVIACDSASVSAPDGVKPGHPPHAVRHHPALQRQRTQSGEDEPQQVGHGQHDLGAQRAAEQQAERGETRGAERDDHRTRATSPPMSGRQPRAKPMAPNRIDCRNTTVTTASDLPAMMPHTGSAVAPSRFSAP